MIAPVSERYAQPVSMSQLGQVEMCTTPQAYATRWRAQLTSQYPCGEALTEEATG
jgi:hypothetical protein